jgi:hypothetical protein
LCISLSDIDYFNSFYCFACKNRFLHDALMHYRGEYKICHLKTSEQANRVKALGSEKGKN